MAANPPEPSFSRFTEHQGQVRYYFLFDNFLYQEGPATEYHRKKYKLMKEEYLDQQADEIGADLKVISV